MAWYNIFSSSEGDDDGGDEESEPESTESNAGSMQEEEESSGVDESLTRDIKSIRNEMGDVSERLEDMEKTVEKIQSSNDRRDETISRIEERTTELSKMYQDFEEERSPLIETDSGEHKEQTERSASHNEEAKDETVSENEGSSGDDEMSDDEIPDIYLSNNGDDGSDESTEDISHNDDRVFIGNNNVYSTGEVHDIEDEEYIEQVLDLLSSYENSDVVESVRELHKSDIISSHLLYKMLDMYEDFDESQNTRDISRPQAYERVLSILNNAD